MAAPGEKENSLDILGAVYNSGALDQDAEACHFVFSPSADRWYLLGSDGWASGIIERQNVWVIAFLLRSHGAR